MVALLSKFRRADRVVIDSRDGFYDYVDGWRGVVAVVGPAEPTACHSQVPGGHCLVECDNGSGQTVQLTVPFDHLRLSV